MAIKGFQGTSLLDFPQRVASLVFYGGCNLRCPYCHNPELVQQPDNYPDIPLTDIVAMLEQRCGFIDGVVVSGGEPTLNSDLPELLRQIKSLQLQVKLDTNGLRPQVLAALLEQELLDFVGLDVKTAPNRYGQLHNVAVDAEAILQSVEILKNAAVEVEFRTTCVPHIVTLDDIHAIGEILRGAPQWVLQQFVAAPAMDEELRQCEPYSTQQLQEFATVGQQYVAQVILRGL
ncbi:MAG: anaerobic ribonucleoside-triphosphate reductase activating protein [Desulfuromonas sp.]|nr:anaerobic ribonucleoside-triphosphate reductase activating protein [Desulfuromonas sp.]